MAFRVNITFGNLLLSAPLRELRNVPGGRLAGPLYFGRWHDEIDADLDSLGLMAVPALIEALYDRDPMVIFYAVRQLGKLGDLRAVEPLIHRLDRPERHFEDKTVIEALGELKDPRAIDPLVRSLKAGANASTVAQALYMIGDERVRAYEPVLGMLEDANPKIRASAVMVLCTVDVGRAFEPIMKVLENDKDPQVRGEAAERMRCFPGPRAIAALERALTDPSPQVRGQAKSALFDLEHPQPQEQRQGIVH